MSDCNFCGREIKDNDRQIGYSDLPFHKNCLKNKYREDNPQLTQNAYNNFHDIVEDADKIRKDGNVLIPIRHPRGA